MLWIKAFHIIAVVCWFAGLFYMPRLFVYHSMSKDDISRERFKVMERKLYRGIMMPSMIATLGLGSWLAALNWQAYTQQYWLMIKIILVAILVGYHFMCGAYRKKFLQETVQPGHIFFRWFNEFPVLILVAVVILAVVRPI
ncbi:MAG: CopD family protein [Pseudomonadales bacterium]